MQQRQKKRLSDSQMKWTPFFVENFGYYYLFFFQRNSVDGKKEQELNKVSKLITKQEICGVVTCRAVTWRQEKKKHKRKLFEADSGWNSCRTSHRWSGFFSFVVVSCIRASFRHPIRSFGGCTEMRRWEFQVADTTKAKLNMNIKFQFSIFNVSCRCGRGKIASLRIRP